MVARRDFTENESHGGIMRKWVAALAVVAISLAGCSNEDHWERDAKKEIDREIGSYPSLDEAYVVESSEYANFVAVCGRFTSKQSASRYYDERRFVVLGSTYKNAPLSNVSVHIDDDSGRAVSPDVIESGPKTRPSSS